MAPSLPAAAFAALPLPAVIFDAESRWAALNEALGGGFQPAQDTPSLATTKPAAAAADKANP